MPGPRPNPARTYPLCNLSAGRLRTDYVTPAQMVRHAHAIAPLFSFTPCFSPLSGHAPGPLRPLLPTAGPVRPKGRPFGTARPKNSAIDTLKPMT